MLLYLHIAMNSCKTVTSLNVHSLCNIRNQASTVIASVHIWRVTPIIGEASSFCKHMKHIAALLKPKIFSFAVHKMICKHYFRT